jgi:hypothetical protein
VTERPDQIAFVIAWKTTSPFRQRENPIDDLGEGARVL